MLQQTQVSTVIPYYARFLEAFPTLADLAAAPLERVLELWSGLGYYARARHLHACAVAVCAQYGGHFPPSPELIAQLPGIGRSTAAAIGAFAFDCRAAILDGNVKRVLTRCFGIAGFPGSPKVEKGLWALAEALLPEAPDMSQRSIFARVTTGWGSAGWPTSWPWAMRQIPKGLPSLRAAEAMLQAKPGCYVWLGNGPGEGGCTLHNPRYDFNDQALALGVSYWVALAEAALGSEA